MTVRWKSVTFRTVALSNSTDQCFCVLNGPLICLKCEPPLGFWVRSHHCLCHHLLWLPNLHSRNQGSQTSTETNTMKREGTFWDFAQAASGFNTFNRTQSRRRQTPPHTERALGAPTHGKTTVRWYSGIRTPPELALSRANSDQCTDSWICFPPKLLIV